LSLVSLRDVGVAFGAESVLEGVTFRIETRQRIAVVGANGAGKTTLIETLAGMRELEQGKLLTGHNVKVGFLSQHADELNTGTARNVVEATGHATGLTPGKARALLGQFLFSGEDAEKPIHGLSGGERRRLSLAILVHSGANVLILDEPTNHLDLESREALEAALGAFPGSLLLVSHDRALLDAIGTRTVALEDQQLHSYVGGWPEYVRIREERRAAGSQPRPRLRRPQRTAAPALVAAGEPSPAAASVREKQPAGASKNRLRAQEQAERAVEAAEETLATLEQELADPAAWATKYEAAKSEARHTAARRGVEAAYAELEALL